MKNKSIFIILLIVSIIGVGICSGVNLMSLATDSGWDSSYDSGGWDSGGWDSGGWDSNYDYDSGSSS